MSEPISESIDMEGAISSLRSAIESQRRAIDALLRMQSCRCRGHIEAAAPVDQRSATAASAGWSVDGRDPDGGLSFTRRQAQVLELLANGASNRRIARTLGIKEQTVKAHIHAVFQKLGASHRTEAVAFAYRSGCLRADSA